MKTCPVCKSGAFDDAEVCYGCLHQFKSQQLVGQKESAAKTKTASSESLPLANRSRSFSRSEIKIPVVMPDSCKEKRHSNTQENKTERNTHDIVVEIRLSGVDVCRVGELLEEPVRGNHVRKSLQSVKAS